MGITGSDGENKGNRISQGYDNNPDLLKSCRKSRQIISDSVIKKHIDNGVIFMSFDNIFIDNSVKIGCGTVIYPDNHLRNDTTIGKNCTIEAGNIIDNSIIGNNVYILKSVIRDSSIGNNTTVGAFSNVHSNSKIEKNCRIGNFVEVKNSTVGIASKAAHLAYIGDVDIGSSCNIGCGAIFVNYDGKNKHRSSVGDSVFIGSNSNIIAPVNLEDNSYICAATTVTVDLPKNSFCIGRNRETIKENRSTYRKHEYKKKYFGTDGIRGIYDEFLNENIAYLCGNYLGYSSDEGTIIVGRDNRSSGKALSSALINGITDTGTNVIDLGIVPTPAIAFITATHKANYGIVISASHNPPNYNGIKIFNYDGRKLTNIEEIEIEKHIEKAAPFKKKNLGTFNDDSQPFSEYLDNLKSSVGNLNGLKIVLDCSNGAASQSAPQLFKDLGAEVFAMSISSDGDTINDHCGALYPQNCASKVIEVGADIGLAFDGDADRLIAIDANGNIVNGDSIIYMIAKDLKQKNLLNNDAVVGTFHTNMGVENSLKKLGITLYRTDIGDHFVMEKMLKNNLLVGGEQSGHIILRQFSNTGDGVLVGLYLCKLIKESRQNLSELNDCEVYPQININVLVHDKDSVMNNVELLKIKLAMEIEMGEQGRILLRASGTEPKVRIMSECKDFLLADKIAKTLEEFILLL